MRMDGPAALLFVSSVQRLYESARLGLTAAIISRLPELRAIGRRHWSGAGGSDALHRLKSKAVAAPVLVLGPPELQLAHESI